METNELPPVLTSVIGSEPFDFAVKAGLRRPVRRSVGQIATGLVFTAATGIFVAIFLSARKNAEPGSAEAGSETMVILLLSFFLIAGISILASAIIRAFRRGGYFVGTPKHLIHYKSGKHSSIDWKKFAGDTQVTGNDRKGTITLVMRPENLSRAESEFAYVPDVIYITAVRNAFEIERMIRRRIKENDPTPARR